MREVFADAGYWIALISPRDNLHRRALAVSQALDGSRIVTSDMVLIEVLNAFAERGEHLRVAAARAVAGILDDAATIVVPQTRRLFHEALALYAKRPDQCWSLTDCASSCIMRAREITEALAHDEHFVQMGYTVLLR
jgi:uncharacterized protein